MSQPSDGERQNWRVVLFKTEKYVFFKTKKTPQKIVWCLKKVVIECPGKNFWKDFFKIKIPDIPNFGAKNLRENTDYISVCWKILTWAFAPTISSRETGQRGGGPGGWGGFLFLPRWHTRRFRRAAGQILAIFSEKCGEKSHFSAIFRVGTAIIWRRKMLPKHPFENFRWLTGRPPPPPVGGTHTPTPTCQPAIFMHCISVRFVIWSRFSLKPGGAKRNPGILVQKQDQITKQKLKPY